MGRLIVLLAAAFIGTIVAANVAFNYATASHRAPDHQPWALDTMQFVTWNGERWTAWIHEGAFELRPEHEGKWTSHANPSLAFLDTDGNNWQVKIDGETFVLANRGDWEGPTQRASAIRYRDWMGQEQLRTVAQLGR
ncbi:MAG: hypothetical protein V3R81_14270 [Gammaproteobacteria bacterium]